MIVAKSLSGGALLKVNNLSDLLNALTARTNLGLGSLAVASWPASDGQEYVAKNGAWAVKSVAVSSVFGRTGAVAAQSGDYTAAQVGAVALAGDTMTGLLKWSGTTHAGLQLNSLTTAQRDALTPAAGMLVWNTSISAVQRYGTAWKTLAELETANTWTAAQAIGGTLIAGTYATVINPATHTRVGIGSSGANYHSLLAFYDSTGTKKYDVGYDPSNTRFYIYDGSGNIFQSTDAGATTIGRSGGTVSFGVGSLTLDGGSGNTYFSYTSTTTTGAVGIKYQIGGASKWEIALLGLSSTPSLQYAGPGHYRIFNSAANYTALTIEPSLSMVGINTGQPAAQMHINQRSTTAAIPVLRLNQADLSEEFIRFESTVGAGNAIDTAALGAYYGKVKVYVEGVGAKWLALYD